ncbi:MAG: hypothetical protein Kow009_07910 [Spirochaetales bacterium]
MLYLVNQIAEMNGYRRLGSVEDLRPDPNWIYPGNQFELPDASIYVVEEGDTLWGIATRYIEQEIAKGLRLLESYLGPALESPVPADRNAEFLQALETLQRASHCKAFTDFLAERRKEVLF